MERANEGANILFGTVDALFGTADSGGTGNEEGKEHFAPPDAPAAVCCTIEFGIGNII